MMSAGQEDSPASRLVTNAGLAVIAVREALTELQDAGDKTARGDDAEMALQRATEAVLERAAEYLEAQAHDSDPDEHLADFLATLGDVGVEAAKAWTESEQARRDGFPMLSEDPGWRARAVNREAGIYSRTIALVLWRGRVRADVEEKRAKEPKKPAALSLLFVNDLSNVYLNPRNQVRVSLSSDGRAAAAILSPDGRELANTPVLNASEIERAQRGVVAFRSYLGQRALRLIPGKVWSQHIAGERNPRVLSFNGVAGFLEWMEVSSKFHADALALLRAGQDFRRTWGDNGRPRREVGGLWSYDLDAGRAGTGKHAHLEVNVNRPLAPFFVRAELERGDDRTLVPLVPMPPVVGSPNTWAGQAGFQFALVRALVESRAEIALHGGVHLSPEDLVWLADEAGMKSRELLRRVLDRWLSKAEGDAVLELVGRDRYHLADNAPYGQARRYITETGNLSERRRQAGKTAARRRRRR